MTSLSIHGLDQRLALKIKEKATTSGMSINRTVKSLLEQALGIRPCETELYRKDFEDLCGIWSDSEMKDFESAVSDLGRTEKSEWE